MLPKFNRVEAKMSHFAAFATLQPCNLDIFKVWKSDFVTFSTFAPLTTLIPFNLESQILQLLQPCNFDTFKAVS